MAGRSRQWKPPGNPRITPLSPEELPHHADPQPRGPSRPLERASPQEGDPRLVRLRHPRHRPRWHGRAEDPRRRGHGQRPVQAGRPDPRGRRLPRPDRRVRARAGQGRPEGRRPALHRDRRRRRRDPVADEARRRGREPASRRATRATSPRTGTPRSSPSSCPATRTRPRTASTHRWRPSPSSSRPIPRSSSPSSATRRPRRRSPRPSRRTSRRRRSAPSRSR